MTRLYPIVLLAGLFPCLVCRAESPLHPRIDKLIAARFDGEPAALADDAEFFRRVNLDLAGRIPSAAATRQFLADGSENKRQATVDRLLAAPEYARRMTNLFHVMLMERRGDNDEWTKFLQTCFEQNKPWDQIVRAILKPNPAEEQVRGAAYFYTRRLEKVGQNPTDYPGLTRDVGRLFLGVDLQCAECHDHLFIDDYKQREFQGLFAVYQNISIRREEFPAVSEKAMTAKLDFVSVFDPTKNSTGPRIPFGKEFEIPEPPAEDPAAKKKKPDPNAPPSFSALSLIADQLPSGQSDLFRRNIANRLWFVMMGRGIVEPLDQFHSSNPATHPELLQLLADELAAHDFDMKWMIRELALTDTWQRSSRLESDGETPPVSSYRLGNQRRLTAEQLFWSVLQATGNLERLAPQAGAEPSEAFTALQAEFLKAFAAEPKEPPVDYTPAVKQALFLSNSTKVLDLLKPQAGNLAERVSQLDDTAGIVDELYLSIFSRPPAAAERDAVIEYLTSAADKSRAVEHVAWAMLSSIEFSVNH